MPRVDIRATRGAWAANSGYERPRQRLHKRCVGCGNQGRPGGLGRPNRQHRSSGNRHRRTRRVGAAAALERRAVRREPQAVVRSTLPEARAEVSAHLRPRLHGAVRSGGAASGGDGRAPCVVAGGGSGRYRRVRGQRGSAQFCGAGNLAWGCAAGLNWWATGRLRSETRRLRRWQCACG